MGDTRVVFTFQTTTQAMAWEKACKEVGLPGRLIPMPVQISAECGLVWLIASQDKEHLLTKAIEFNLKYVDVIELQ